MARTREQDAERKRDDAAENKDVQVRDPEDMERRRRLESDDEAWLLHYFSRDSGVTDPFWYEFTAQQKEMIAAIRNAILKGGDQAIAASRGEGKTTICERLVLKYVLSGAVSFAVLFAATGEAATDSLSAIKEAIEENDLLAADYPEVCDPVRALENTPNRAHYQTVSGKRLDNGEAYYRRQSKFTWCGREIVLPKVPGSPSSRAIIATRGLDSAVRGLKKKGRRPQVAIIDDPDTEETARSEDQAAKLEQRIDRAIAALGSQKRRIARVMLTTLQSRLSVSYKFTDASLKPSWKGRRFRFLLTPPDRIDLWEEFVALWKLDQENEKKGEPTSFAPELYAAKRTEMDAGAAVSNPNRYNDGELSALQFYYTEVARTSPEAVATEYDNDPPEDAGPVESGIHPILIQKQLSGVKHGTIPDGCTVLTHAIDVGKWKLYWVVRAWKPDATGYTIDYGTKDVIGAKYKSDEGLDTAIAAAILRRLDEFASAAYCTARGEMISDPLSLVDASYRTDAVYRACAQAGIGVYPIMGFGKSAGCAQANFSPAQKRSVDVRPGDGWKMVRKGRVWLVEADADRWKAWEHDRWMSKQDQPGCMFLYGTPAGDGERFSDDERGHAQYAAHICAEVEIEEVVKGVMRRKWKPKNKENHWFDASYYSDVAANIKGVRLTGPMVAKPAKSIPGHVATKPKLSLAEMAAAAK